MSQLATICRRVVKTATDVNGFIFELELEVARSKYIVRGKVNDGESVLELGDPARETKEGERDGESQIEATCQDGKEKKLLGEVGEKESGKAGSETSQPGEISSKSASRSEGTDTNTVRYERQDRYYMRM